MKVRHNNQGKRSGRRSNAKNSKDELDDRSEGSYAPGGGKTATIDSAIQSVTREDDQNNQILQSKKDFIEFGSPDKPAETQKRESQKRSQSTIDAIFKQVKKSHDSYSRHEFKQQEEREPHNREEHKYPEKTNTKVAWMSKRTSGISSSIVRAHNEIIEFVDYIVPTKEDHRIREKSFSRLEDKITAVFPDCLVKAFGSFATKIYLPSADIDLVVMKSDTPSTSLLHKLAQVLMKDDEYEQIQIIRSAKVPLVKLVEKTTKINFDISFNKLDGVKQIKIVESALKSYPEMRYLIVVLKCMLRQRDLHETYHGGVGSFLLFCLVLTFVRELKRDYISIEKRHELKDLLLSEMLLMLFEFYGINFDTSTKTILIANGGGITDKIVKDNSLSVISPQDTSHDIGGPAFRIRDIFNMFKNRYHFLTNYNFSEGESFMQYLIDPYTVETWKEEP